MAAMRLACVALVATLSVVASAATDSGVLSNADWRLNLKLNSMLDHTSITVKDFEASKKFYDVTLDILGYKRTFDAETGPLIAAGYGREDLPEQERSQFWILKDKDPDFPDEKVGNSAGLHFAFRAPTVESIKDWYVKCLELGALDNGKPGPRIEYGPGYYAAFIVDPSGIHLEAVLHDYTPDQGMSRTEA